MMLHYGSQDYAVAASEAAKFARTKYEGMIERGKKNMGALLSRVDSLVPDDMIVNAHALKFHANPDTGIVVDVDGKNFTVHNHAIGQLGTRSGIEMTRTLKNLIERDKDGKVIPWKADLAAKMLNESYSHLDANKRFLARSINDDIRGFLSDSFRRYDVRPIMGAFIEGIRDFGAVPLDGFTTGTKVSCRVVLPYLFEPITDEVMLYGLEFRNSDFGDGKLLVRSFVDRVWCTNLCTLEDEISKIHLGSKLPENLEFSQKTYELDTLTMASAMKDVVAKVLNPKQVNETMARIKSAGEDVKDANSFRTVLRSLNKGESQKVTDAFENGDDVTYLPKGKSTWRMSNAISWLATQTESVDRKMELEALAGTMLGKVETIAA